MASVMSVRRGFLLCALLPVAVFALAESTTSQGSNAREVQDLYGQFADGIKIGIIGSQNVYLPHEAFDSNNIFNHTTYGLPVDPCWHDTRIAGIIASRGSATHPDDVGIAPDAEIHSIRIGDVEEALRKLVLTYNCQAIVTGVQWQSSDPNFENGDSFPSRLYDYYAYEHNILFANAAGNSMSHISVVGDAYNGITTGGLRLNDPGNDYVYRQVGSLSNPGPTLDARRKPDIVAPADAQTVPASGSFSAWADTERDGGGATSWAAPHTVAVGALLLGLAEQTPVLDDDRHEVIKAVIVNSAFPNIDTKQGASTAGSVFNYQRGYGRIDALRAYETLMAQRIYPDQASFESKGWAFDSVAPYQEDNYYIANVGQADRLIVTLCWDRRIELKDRVPKGIISENELTAYNANLDLEIYEPAEPDPIFSETLNGLNPRDNLEKCDLLITVPGEYLIKIVNRTADETPSYAIAFEILEPLVGDFDLNYVVDFKDLDYLLGQWLWSAPDLPADIWPDNIINLLDLAVFGRHWLDIDQRYADLTAIP
ncbi:MAG: S8 family serine peptidase [Planctomycetota bacterium]